MEEAEHRLSDRRRPPVMMAISPNKRLILGNRYQTEAALAAAWNRHELAAQANDPAGDNCGTQPAGFARYSLAQPLRACRRAVAGCTNPG